MLAAAPCDPPQVPVDQVEIVDDNGTLETSTGTLRPCLRVQDTAAAEGADPCA